MSPHKLFKLLAHGVEADFDSGYISWDEYGELLDFLIELKESYE